MSNKERTFEFKGETYKVIVPTSKIRRESDAVYAKTYRKSIQDGFFLEAEVEELLKSRKLDEKSLSPQKNVLQKELNKLQKRLELNKFPSLIRAKDTADEMKKLRQQMEDLDSAKNELSSQSASSIAENKRFSYYAYACILDNEEERVWEDFEDFMEDESELAFRAASEIITLLYDANKVFIQANQKTKFEINWLVENGFLDEELNETDPNSKPPNPPKKKTKKKTATRKKAATKKTPESAETEIKEEDNSAVQESDSA